jgi:MFS family permease
MSLLFYLGDDFMGTQRQQSLFRNQSFLCLMVAQAISNLGDYLDVLALLALVALKWNATPTQMAFVMLSFAVPMVVFGPLTGVLADRINRKLLMIFSDLVRAGLVLSLVWVTEIWHVYIILILRGIFEAIFTPAKNGKLKEIIPDEQMEKATSFSTIIDQGAKIAGPMISGALVTTAGVAAAFYIDAASFVISGMFLLGLKKDERTSRRKSKHEKTNVIKDLKEGLQVVIRVPFLLYGTVLFTLAMLVLQIADSQIMIFFREIQNASTAIVGTAMATSGLGMIVSAGLLSQKSGKSPLTLMAVGSVLIGLVYTVSGFVNASDPAGLAKYAWYVIPGLFFMGGAAAGMVMIPFQAGAQKRTPVKMTGRVFGTVHSAATAASILGPLAGAFLVTALGVNTAFMIAGGLIMVIGLVTLTVKNGIERRDQIVAQSNGITQGTTTV